MVVILFTRLFIDLPDPPHRKSPFCNMLLLPIYRRGQETQLQLIEIWIRYSILLPEPANVLAR
jgi:hypothetical protein